MRLTVTHIDRGTIENGVEPVTLHTDLGDIVGRYHPANRPTGKPLRAVVWVGGAGGGLDGPAGGLYPAACQQLQSKSIAGLRIHYRRPNALPDCILDTLIAVAFLHAEGAGRIALVGHSFGGAVVISAGALSGEVTAVVPISTQTYGAELASRVSPRPMLIIHGTADELLSPVCSELVFAAARDPKEIKLFAGARHGLDSVRDDLLKLLVTWLDKHI
jgi:pimeloyl-ACP methyl ester carboxylesterase